MRVVSLLPSATEIVAALGEVDSLVGVTHECDYPSMVSSLPRVTACAVDASAPPAAIDAQVREVTGKGRSLYTLDEGLIRSLRPDLILTQALCEVCAVTEADVRALAARLDPAPHVESLSATTFEGVLADIARVAGVLSAEDECEELLVGVRARLLAVHSMLKAARAPRPRVAVLEWTDPPFAAGHWVPEMVSRAGGVDVLATTGEPSKVVSLDSVVAAAPDVVLVAPCGYGLARAVREAAGLCERSGWRSPGTIPLWALDANALTSRPGPRVVDGIEVMARIFNPSLFSPLDGSLAQRVDAPAAAPR